MSTVILIYLFCIVFCCHDINKQFDIIKNKLSEYDNFNILFQDKDKLRLIHILFVFIVLVFSPVFTIIILIGFLFRGK